MLIKTNASFRRAMLMSASAAAITAVSSAASAQSAVEATDEVVVTGIRAALERSVDIKRNAKGIVDSISAEDMGKFPDSNLAESLQRVTGVSIDRNTTSNEGQYVTVRGFGADYNLVTLNGRTMPTSTLGNFASAPSTRSFDFGNLAPEAVSRVDIYKTAKSTTASGGVGSTIDIRSTRPLDAPGMSATVGFRHVKDDTSDERGGDRSFLVSNTFLDDRIGVSLSAVTNQIHHTSASFRHSWASGFEAMGDDEFFVQANDELDTFRDGANSTPAIANGHPDTMTNRPADGVLIANLKEAGGYYIDDLEQTRDNYQLTFQARVLDNLTLTADLTHAELEHEINESRLTVWADDNSVLQYGLDTVWGEGNPATPVSMTYNHNAWNTWGRFDQDGNTSAAIMDANGANGRGTDDLDSAQMYQNNTTELESVGLNLEWDVDERLSLALDFHESSSESSPLSPYGSSASIGSIRSISTNWTVDYTKEIPNIVMRNDNDEVLADVIQPNMTFFTGATNINSMNKNEIEQTRLTGSFDFAGTDFEDFIDTMDFGVSVHTNEVTSAFGEVAAPNWGGLAPAWGNAAGDGANWDSAIWEDNLTDLRPYYAGLGGSELIFPQFVKSTYQQYFDAYSAYQLGQNLQGSSPICGTALVADCLADYTALDTFEEEISSVYIQLNKDFDLLDRPASLVAGLRYEETDVTSSTVTPDYNQPTWVDGADDIFAPVAGTDSSETRSGSYDNLLPSFDLSVEYTDDIKLRFGYSETITRQGYGNLKGGVTINPLLSDTKGTNGETGNASSGDPALEPFESENIDFAAEYYYGDRSYLSLGYFAKNVSGYVGTGFQYLNVQGIRNPAYNTDGTAVANQGADSSILADDSNELVLFKTSVPAVSDREETVDGLEFAIQHDFEDTEIAGVSLDGFGVIANLTVVDTDATYNNTLPNSQASSQFAIVGISDSYNVIGYYEKDGLSARVAYNWRDRFLNFSGASSGYTEEYDSIDANISYQIPGTDVTLTYDGINLGEEGRRTFERNNPAYVTWVSPGAAKHYLGIRWNM